MPSVFVSLFLFACLWRKHETSLFSNVQTSHGTLPPSFLASQVEDTAVQRLTDPDQSGVHISDKFTAYSQRERLKLLHLICHRRETRAFLEFFIV